MRGRGGWVENFLRTSFEFFFECVPIQNRTPPPLPPNLVVTSLNMKANIDSLFFKKKMLKNFNDSLNPYIDSPTYQFAYDTKFKAKRSIASDMNRSQ